MSDQHLPTGKVSWWNLETRQELRSKAVPGMNTAAVSPDGSRVAAALWKSQWNVLVWDAVTGDSLAELPQQSVVRSLAFAPDSKLLAIGKEDKMATIWNLETKTPLAHEVHLDHVWATAFSPDGSRLASATLGGAIKVWDLKFAEEATTIPIPKLSALQFAADGKTLLVGTPQATKVIDVPSGREIAELPVGGVKAIAAKVRVGARLASSDQALIFDLQSGRQIANLSLPGAGTPGLAWSPNGERLATFRSWKGYKKVHVWDLATQQERTFQPEMGCHSVMSAAFSPDGKWLAAGFQFQLLTVWDTASGKIKLQFNLWPFMMNIVAISVSPDSRWVAVGTDVGAVTIWDIATGKQIADCKGHALPVRSLSFSPDGGTLATASDDQTVKLWDTITGQERSTLSGHQGAVSRVQFSSDGNTIATTSNDGTVKLWRAAAHAAVQDPKNLDLGTGQAFAQAQMRQWEQAAKSCELAVAKAQQASAERRPALLTRCLEDCDAIAKQMFAAGEHSIALGMYERNIPLADLLGAETTPEGRLSQSLRYNDLAFCYFPLQQLPKAELAIGRAIELKAGLAKEFPANGSYPFHLAHSHLGLAYIRHAAGNASGALESFRTAGAEFEKSAKLKGNWQTWKDSGRAYATSGEWSKAAAAFNEAVRLRPGDHALWIDLAALSAMAGDRTNYERVCREMLERHPELHQPFGPSEKPMIAERIAKACAILPWEGKEFSQVETLADLAVADAANPTFRWSALAKALVEYRGKRFQSAVDWVNRFEPSPDGSHADALAYAALALAQQRLGDKGRASEALQRSESIVTAKKPTPGRHLFDANDQNWLIADLLLREARAEVNKVNP
jgi:WD40 repeat protein/tetratricopeptide (TPR) repeat protein